MALQKLNIVSKTFSNVNGRLFSLSTTVAKTFREKYRDFWTPKPRFVPPYEHFTQVGDPVLRTEAALVPQELVDSKEVRLVTDRMIKILHKYDCVGVAAPQVGVSLRIIALEFHEGKKEQFSEAVYKARKMSTFPLTVVINPVLKVTDYSLHKHPEGCMSVRGFTAEVERYDSVLLTGLDRKGAPLELKLNGWNARIAQHEMDHLNGKLYIDTMDRATFACTCWQVINNKGGRVEIPFYK
ncbi:peptide deformylase, mitochondrial-like [Teleopsis dalmanni]|uniref:peptide deformylase, mitochondrial-like n=1 Tax=Teleopsis dalmanni TaxID=139649 RepID=UPI000D32AA6E|nr:peptide deformylase, mitochondrial-like [Teleopsis dalmanni]